MARGRAPGDLSPQPVRPRTAGELRAALAALEQRCRAFDLQFALSVDVASSGRQRRDVRRVATPSK
jgi:hypothetical protein